MSQEYEDRKLPKATMALPPDPSDWIFQIMGVVTGLHDYDKFFLMANLFMKFVQEVEEAKRQGLFKDNVFKRETDQSIEEIKVDVESDIIAKLKIVWYGNVYFVVHRHPDRPWKVTKRETFFHKPKQRPNMEIIKLPALKNMNPLTDIRSVSWGIEIREDFPVKYAYEDMDFEQVVLQGGLSKKFMDGTFPYFRSQQDIENSTARTYVLAKPIFFTIIEILEMVFMSQFTKLYVRTYKYGRELKFGKTSETEQESEESTRNVTELV